MAAGPASKRKAPPAGQPIVSTTDRAALLFGLDGGRLAGAVAAAGLSPWGRHASGAAVYRWADLVAVAQRLGVNVPTVPRGVQALTVKADRGRANRHRKGGKP
jgi:hypothetical protein